MSKNISAYSSRPDALRILSNLGACALLTIVFTSNAFAQVYKCTFTDEVTRQNKVVYTDSACGKAEKQTLTPIQAKAESSMQVQQRSQTPPSAGGATLDIAVTNAVLNRDFKLARSLANTKEHWRLISIAEGEALLPPAIVANNQAVASREAECSQAKDDFDVISRTSWRDKDLVAAKKSIMYVACGVPEPVQNQPIFVGRTLGGGLHSGRWYHPNAKPHQVRPHKGVGHQPYPVGHHYHGRHSTGSSASLSYKSKHFSINADSTNVR